jgi:hypothetical protein
MVKYCAKAGERNRIRLRLRRKTTNKDNLINFQ